MGPFCGFCHQRCSVPFPADAPETIKQVCRARYPDMELPLLATCPKGQDHDERYGIYSLRVVQQFMDAMKEETHD